MTNKDKMLQMVLSDEHLNSFYEFDANDYPSIEDALKADKPVVAIATIIKDFNGASGKGSTFSDVYREVFNYLLSNFSVS